ncbi:endonuclease/exonuclease/phosphatase family metal-dependent hydrolase [Saccharopolyspora lacisalsi]|uniref:Endonuclease/exonuclease/phosphatase family metal-dependent hydrolase n=1 Tax=Halosaccharopolyspora lacisalsi TaxID=1000566 RepID=A0A839DSA4_9PSEU|nr:endonuclease/exonuclease/phosphatase family protein [Halosaccharopolyspora lacisalsi]MBA8823840.1 endonuclease/exonuclease/phosphatase family metal-dependent hydrolase [Halosaccharopolyspora lacisalsi]
MSSLHRRISATLSALLALVAMAVATPLAAAGDREHRGKPEPDVTVLSYNIHHGEGVDGTLDLGRVAEVIRDSGAGVVALQEVDRHWSARSDFADQAQELARRLGMHHAYGANLDRDPAAPGQPRRQYGTAILSRFPIVSSRNTPLPNLGGEQRGLLQARITVCGRTASVYSTHLQHDNAAERAAQTEAVADLVGSATEPVILAGDLNARPGSPEMEPIRFSFTDTFAVAGTGDGATYPATDPSARIDYVVTNDHVRTRSAEVLRSPASDHLPVRAEVALTAPYATVPPLERAHAHNDYEHRRPLFDALHHGFT